MASKIKKTKGKARFGQTVLAEGAERDQYKLAGRIWVEKNGLTFLGWGRIVLLERIAEHGSLNRAARSMRMSYRRAWELMERMNRLSPKPLVETSIGGRGGGGSRLTAEGEAAVANFWALVAELSEWLERSEPRLWLVPEKPGRRGAASGSGRARPAPDAARSTRRSR